LKKVWFKLIDKDLYYFKTKNDTNHKGMHNLSGVYVQENTSVNYENVKLWSFSVIYPKKIRNYYVDNENEYNLWISGIRRATGYANLKDIYEVKVKLLNF
jgi:hypothetical protein